MTFRDEEPGILSKITAHIIDWLISVKAAVFSAGRDMPDPTGVNATRGMWVSKVDQFLDDLEEVARTAWVATVDEPYISTNSFVQAQLAITRNLLVRLPDDVYNRIFAEISEGQAAGESTEQIADRIDVVLTFTGSEWWPNRAGVIAATETHRAWMSGVLAAAQYNEPAGGRGWVKEWVSKEDADVRPAHRRADGQIRTLRDTFTVGGESLMYPGDASGRADLVIRCRCDMLIKER